MPKITLNKNYTHAIFVIAFALLFYFEISIIYCFQLTHLHMSLNQLPRKFTVGNYLPKMITIQCLLTLTACCLFSCRRTVARRGDACSNSLYFCFQKTLVLFGAFHTLRTTKSDQRSEQIV